MKASRPSVSSATSVVLPLQDQHTVRAITKTMMRGRWRGGRIPSGAGLPTELGATLMLVQVGSICLVISYTEVFAGKPDGERNLVQPTAGVKKIRPHVPAPPGRTSALCLSTPHKINPGRGRGS